MHCMPSVVKMFKRRFLIGSQDILQRTRNNQTLNWYKTLHQYYWRPQWELFDLKADPTEKFNVAKKDQYKVLASILIQISLSSCVGHFLCWTLQEVFEELKQSLFDWQNRTRDPWLCSPSFVLEDKGAYKHRPSCLPLF